MLRNRNYIFSSFLVMMFIASGLSIVAGPSENASLTSEKPFITINIKDAYYFDGDNDGIEDDTFASVELFLSGKNRITFDYWITLTLPSGFDFLFGLSISTKYNYLELNHTLIETALEPGWYHLHVEIVQKTGGVYYTDAEHIFDPPGSGHTGVPPSMSTSYSGY